MSENYLNSLYYKTKNEWVKDQNIHQTSLYQDMREKKRKRKEKKQGCKLDFLEKQLDEYIDSNYNRQIYKQQIKENSLYQITQKVKRQQKLYKYKDHMYQMQNNLDMIDKVVESVLEYNNRQNSLIQEQTFLHYLAQRYKQDQENIEKQYKDQYNSDSRYDIGNSFDYSSKYLNSINSSQLSKNNLQKKQQNQMHLDPKQRQIERLRQREIELRKFEEEQKLKKFSSLIDRHKKQVDQMYNDYSNQQFKKYNDEIRQIEQEKLNRQRQQQMEQEEWERKKQLKKNIYRKLKTVFLVIQLFKKSARDYKIQARQMRLDYDSQQEKILQKYLNPCLNQISMGFLKSVLEQYDASKHKYYIVTNDKFFLNDYQQEPTKPKKLVSNSEYLLNTFSRLILDFQNIVSANNIVIENLNSLFKKTFTKNQFILRDFYSKEFLNRLKLTNYGQLKQLDQVIKRNALIFILINKIIIPIIIKAIENDKQGIGARMVCKVLVSVFYQAQENCQEENLKQQDNNQANLSHEFQIQPMINQIIDKKLKQNNKNQKESYFIDILQSKKMKEFFTPENKIHMNEQINRLALKILNFMELKSGSFNN